MKTLLCALLLTATLGCQSGSARVEQLFGGPEAMAALSAPDSTQAWRTTAKFAVKEGTETKGKLADYVILNGPVPVKESISTAIAGLLKKDIYEWNMAKGCEPIPGVAIDGEVISSTAIRLAIANGNLEFAEKALGRPYAVFGRVVKGLELVDTIEQGDRIQTARLSD